jgi:cyclase
MRREIDMKRIRRSIAVAVGVWLSSPLSASSVEAQEVEIAIVEVVDGIAMLQGRGGNIGVSYGTDGVFLIDDQFAPHAEKVLELLATLSPEPPSFVFNTHWHGDHTGGNEKMSGAGATIVAHDNVRSRMSQDHYNPALKRTTKAAALAALPVVTFSSDVTFHLNSNDIHAVHVDSAHTDGDSVVYFSPANVVHTGDVYFNGFYPFVDLSSAGSPRGVVAAVDQILAIIDEETKVIPGHGPLSNKAELSNYRTMLDTITGRIRKAIDEGQTVEQVLEKKPTADFDAKWGGGFMSPEQFTRIVYAGVQGE